MTERKVTIEPRWRFLRERCGRFLFFSRQIGYHRFNPIKR